MFECFTDSSIFLSQGDLMQLLLIQTQVMKVDMESALLQMDQIMRANRLNFSIMAGMPALIAVMLSGSVGSTSLGELFLMRSQD
jgi:nuclear-control-of-ATPase protein 2